MSRNNSGPKIDRAPCVTPTFYREMQNKGMATLQFMAVQYHKLGIKMKTMISLRNRSIVLSPTLMTTMYFENANAKCCQSSSGNITPALLFKTNRFYAILSIYKQRKHTFPII